MSIDQDYYEDMVPAQGQGGSSDDGWSDDHFSDVDSSDNETVLSLQRYMKVVAATEKTSSIPALPPRKAMFLPPTPPIRSHKYEFRNKERDTRAEKDTPPKEPFNTPPDTLIKAISQLKPAATGCDNEDEDYIHPMNEKKTVPNEPYDTLRPTPTGCEDEDGDYVVPVKKSPSQQLKLLKKSPYTLKEMSGRKKLPIPPKLNSPTGAESASPQKVDTFEWFHGESNREEIKGQLLQQQMEGMFAVRKSNQKQTFHAYSLALYHKGHIYNFQIRTRKQDNKLALGTEKPDEPVFSSLDKLVSYFTENKIKLANNNLVTLTKPLPKFS